MKKLFSMIAALLFAGSMMAASITVAHNSASTTNLSGANQATLFSAGGAALDASVWSFVGQKNDASNNVGLNKDGTIRLYATGKDSGTNGCALVVTLTDGTIQSVSLNIKSGTEVSVLVGGNAVTLDGDLYPVNATSFTIQQTGAKGSTQVQLNSITINYKMNGDVDIDATDIDLDETSLSLGQYREQTLEATLTPANATTTVVWTSSNPAVATVSGGLVKALTLGTTTITAAAGEGVSASCAVTVTAATVLTCEQAAAYAATLSANNEKYPGGQYVVEGYAITTNTATGYIWLADDKDATKGTFEVYLPSNKSEIADVVVGDRIRAHGYISKYNTNYEFLAGCVFEVIADTPAPEIALSETALAFGSFQQDTETSGYNKVVLKSFDITAANLTAPITLDLLGNGFRIIAPGYPNGLVSLTINPTAGAIDTTITVSASTVLTGDFTGTVTISSTAATADFTAITLPLSVTITEHLTYELKNAWDGGEWKWKEMTRVNNDQHKLEGVVFGGGGVNWRTVGETTDGTWIPVDNFQGDIINILDTVNLIFTPSTASIYATLVGEYIAPADPTWTVAGSSDDAFGSSWDPSNTDNDMVKQSDGTFLWEKENITLGAGTINFKVCRDHDWVIAYPASNYSLNIAADGIYTITITFDPSTHAITAVATKTGDAVVIPTIALHGNFTGSWADTELFTPAANEETATLTLALTAGNYEFGMRIGGSGNWTSNGAAFTRTNPSAVVAAGSGNLTIAADVDGDYVFTWTYATNTLTVMFPDEPVVGCDWDNLSFLPTAALPQYDNQFKICLGTPAPGVDVIQNPGWATAPGLYITFPSAEFGAISLAAGEYDIQGAGMILHMDAFTARETEVSIVCQGNEYIFTIYNAKADATGIENNAVVEKAVKFIENGQLFIIKNGVKYNATGAVVR